MNLLDLEYKTSAVLYVQRRGLTSEVKIPQRILSSIANILKQRNTSTKDQEKKRHEKILRDVEVLIRKLKY